MLTPIQILFSVFILFAISRVILRFREKIIAPGVALFWAIVWSAALIGVVLPATTTKIASFFGVGRGVDVIVYISLSLLFYLVFRIYVMIEDLRREITYIVRHVALKNPSKKSSRRKRTK